MKVSIRWFFLGCLLLPFPIHAEVFYKDQQNANASSSIEAQSDMVDCQHGLNKPCQANGKPTKFGAFGDCRVISTANGRGIFIPARSKKEWNGFVQWAKQHPNIVSIDSCSSNPQWTDWSACSSTCGTGVRERKCNRLPRQDGKSACKGEGSQACQDYSGCTCGKIDHQAEICPGQDKGFMQMPPQVSYVEFNHCDHLSKCQAQCQEGFKVAADGGGCSP